MGHLFRSARLFRWFLNIWPPFLGAGIVISKLSHDFRYARVELKKAWWNKNAVGTAYGGSLFSMTDPFYMLLLGANLGKEYLVWDQAAEITFVAPGKTRLYCEFFITESLLQDIETHTQAGDKHLPEMTVLVKDSEDNLVAKVTRVIYVRKKKRFR